MPHYEHTQAEVDKFEALHIAGERVEHMLNPPIGWQEVPAGWLWERDIKYRHVPTPRSTYVGPGAGGEQ